MTETNEKTPQLTRGELKDIGVLALFSSVYCRAHHVGEKSPLGKGEAGSSVTGLKKYPLCAECREFLSYAISRRLRCTLEPKPVCKNCGVHCYRPGHREKVRQIMRFSGKYLIMRGRLDLLWHYFF